VNHWSEERLDDDPGDSLVRPYTITRGRTLPERDDLTLITVVVTLDAEIASGGGRGLQPEHRMILEQCRTPAAVAEISAELNLPVAVTKILIGDLIALGRVATRAPLALAAGQKPDIRLLQAVRDGLLRLNL
jgi:hypothetical protein